MNADQIEALWKKGYNATAYYNGNAKLQKVIRSLKEGFNGESFDNIANYLLTNSPVADPYMCMAEFSDYLKIHAAADEAYKDKLGWAKKSLINIASSGIFSADRAIKEYAENIWNLKPIK